MKSLHGQWGVLKTTLSDVLQFEGETPEVITCSGRSGLPPRSFTDVNKVG